jgi:adenine deaminase
MREFLLKLAAARGDTPADLLVKTARVTGQMPLPVAGLLSLLFVEQPADNLKNIKQKVQTL